MLSAYLSSLASRTWLDPRVLLAVLSASMLSTTSSHAADPAKVPIDPLADKAELLFSDDFEGTQRPAAWHRVVPTFAFEQGVLKGTQTRDKDIPATDGKAAIKAHAAFMAWRFPPAIVSSKSKYASMVPR